VDKCLTQLKTLNFDVETIVVYIQRKDPITLPMVGTGQMSRLNARCLPIVSRWLKQ